MSDYYDYYDIDGNKVGPEVFSEDRTDPSSNFARAHRVTKTGDAEVSTVWLGIDHSRDERGGPVIFETMVFGGNFANDCQRYHTLAEAHAGHDAMVKRVRVEADCWASLTADQKVRDCAAVIKEAIDAHRAAFDMGDYEDGLTARLIKEATS